jgi:hypothetical protein
MACALATVHKSTRQSRGLSGELWPSTKRGVSVARQGFAGVRKPSVDAVIAESRPNAMGASLFPRRGSKYHTYSRGAHPVGARSSADQRGGPMAARGLHTCGSPLCREGSLVVRWLLSWSSRRDCGWRRLSAGVVRGGFLPVVVGAALGAVAQLHGRHDVQHLVDLPVPASGHSMADVVTGGCVDRVLPFQDANCALLGMLVMSTTSTSSRVTGWSDSMQLGERGAGCGEQGVAFFVRPLIWPPG